MLAIGCDIALLPSQPMSGQQGHRLRRHRVCACACVRVCVCVRVRACVCVHARARVCVVCVFGVCVLCMYNVCGVCVWCVCLCDFARLCVYVCGGVGSGAPSTEQPVVCARQ